MSNRAHRHAEVVTTRCVGRGFLYASIDDTNVLLAAGEDGSRYKEYSFVRDPSLTEEQVNSD
jgi:hypothetical protein